MGGPHEVNGETDDERWRRNFSDLLQELRVAQAGVQILFAFLLTLVFQNRFTSVDTFDKSVYLVSLLSAAAAAAMIIAPVAYHRALFRLGAKPELVRSAHRLATGGLAFLLVAMVSAVLLAVDVVLDRWLAITVSVVAGLWYILLWLVMPVFRRVEIDEEGADR